MENTNTNNEYFTAGQIIERNKSIKKRFKREQTLGVFVRLFKDKMRLIFINGNAIIHEQDFLNFIEKIQTA